MNILDKAIADTMDDMSEAEDSEMDFDDVLQSVGLKKRNEARAVSPTEKSSIPKEKAAAKSTDKAASKAVAQGSSAPKKTAVQPKKDGAGCASGKARGKKADSESEGVQRNTGDIDETLEMIKKAQQQTGGTAVDGECDDTTFAPEQLFRAIDTERAEAPLKAKRSQCAKKGNPEKAADGEGAKTSNAPRAASGKGESVKEPSKPRQTAAKKVGAKDSAQQSETQTQAESAEAPGPQRMQKRLREMEDMCDAVVQNDVGFAFLLGRITAVERIIGNALNMGASVSAMAAQPSSAAATPARAVRNPHASDAPPAAKRSRPQAQPTAATAASILLISDDSNTA